VVEVEFDLDDEGHKVEAFMEFFPDGSASIQWSASELPISVTKVMCLIHEIDLIGSLVPFIQHAACLHQFQWNDADRIVRVVSKPPIPFVAGLDAVSQRFGFDLLDSPWGGMCLVECSPNWVEGDGQQWRGVPRPAPYEARLKQVDVKTMVALGRPCGKLGELTTVFFTARGDLKVPRSMLPNWLVCNLVKLIGKFIYQHALEVVAKFDSSEHGQRLHGVSSPLYDTLDQRVARFIQGTLHEDAEVSENIGGVLTA